jgi:hypothetical protein
MQNSQPTSKRVPFTWIKIVFLILLTINFLIELVIAGAMLIDFPQVADIGFGITYTSDIAILGIALGSNLMFASGILLLSIIWTLRAKVEGIIIGAMAGGLFALFGLVAFIQLGDFQSILVDGLRGILTILFAYLTFREIQNNSE